MSFDSQTGQEQPRTSAGSYPWMRILFTLFFFAALWLSFWAIVFVAIAQLVLRAFDADASEDLRSFAGRLGSYMGELVDYLGFARDKPPFPFARFPAD